jgi:hypothetical protein
MHKPNWLFPLELKKLGPTVDSMSFDKIDITKGVEIPVFPHVGSFGAERRHDIHKGVDLYCPEGTPVFAVEDGVLCHVRPFTGEIANCPWWENTWAVSIAGESGVVVYGEINKPKFRFINFSLENDWFFQGKEIKKGDLIGNVKRVLKKDKGRPTSMLHLALHRHGTLTDAVWKIGAKQPEGTLDPTPFLLTSLSRYKIA